jgi:uncharacterized protein (TIGR02453 family)
MARFQGFDAGVPDWFAGLEADNSREYFAAHRAYFDESVRGQFEALLTDLSAEFGGETKIFRQNRDIRFSADKSPYKTQTYGVLTNSTLSRVGLYLSISADGLTAGGGYWGMAPDQLDRYRRAVDAADAGVELAGRVAAVQAAGLEQWGPSLATAPRGYPRDHPRIALLRHKSLALGRRLPVGDGIGPDQGASFVADTWRMAVPVITWLDEHVGPSTLPPARRR